MAVQLQPLPQLTRNITNSIDDLSKAQTPQQFAEIVMRKVEGCLDKIDLHANWLLVCTYVEPEKTAGGIIRPDKIKQEARFQGKVGLVLKIGPAAFQNDALNDFHGKRAEPGDWVWFRYADSWEIGFAGLSCRIVSDAEVKGTTTDPTLFF